MFVISSFSLLIFSDFDINNLLLHVSLFYQLSDSTYNIIPKTSQGKGGGGRARTNRFRGAQKS